MKEFLHSADHILIGGHRGCECDYPENSIRAMEEGIRRGADYLEIDIQMTRDGVPVVFHDTKLEKRTALSGYVHEKEYAELQEKIPGLCTMEEAMKWGKENNVRFGLELKTIPFDMQNVNMRLTEKIPDILQQNSMRNNVFVFGPDYQVLRHLKTLAGEIMIGLIVPFVPADPVLLMKSTGADLYLSYIWNMTPDMIRVLRENGYLVSGAILKDDCWVERAKESGVNMFETDHPEKYVCHR
jgi:glycerophosphoryl diester phosphodiesterase